MMKFHHYSCFAMLTFLVAVLSVSAEDRLLLDATINGKPVKLAFDTGASCLILWSKVATRLGLRFVEQPEPGAVADSGKVWMPLTEECNLATVGQKTPLKTQFAVVQEPMGIAPDMDGLIGWGALTNKILAIDMSQKKVIALDDLPEDRTGWIKVALRPNSDVLFLELPLSGGLSPSSVLVDTGRSDGVGLAPERWRQWRAEHAEQGMTMRAYVSPYSGLSLGEEGWAEKISLGPLDISEVPVTEAGKMDVDIGGKKFLAVLGMAALKRVEIVIDRGRGEAWLRSRNGVAPAYEHNRLGAVFTPTGPQGEDLLAHVAANSPAYEAGIHDGDVLLKVGTLNTTKWRTDPAVLPLSRFWQQPAGTKLNLNLKRGDELIKATPTLRNILPPDKK